MTAAWRKRAEISSSNDNEKKVNHELEIEKKLIKKGIPFTPATKRRPDSFIILFKAIKKTLAAASS